MRQTEISKNNYSENPNYANNNYKNKLFCPSKNKFKLHFTDSESEKSVKKYKNEITNKIINLNNEQKKGLFNIISNDCIDKNIQDNVMEINVNKMTFNQLKQLDKYINRCIRDNKSGLSSPMEKIFELKRSKLLENEKESEILKNDDLSSCLSDDEDDDEDE